MKSIKFFNMNFSGCVNIFWGMLWIISFKEYDCCRFGPGPNCGFQCRCEDSNQCDPETGTCNGGECAKTTPDNFRRRGPGCIIDNVAFAKSNVQQSGQYAYYSAALAVDGNPHPYITARKGESCANPLTSTGQYAWWWVDLEDIYIIRTVIIVNRLMAPGTSQPESVFKERSTDYDIKIGNTSNRAQQILCFQQNKPGTDVQPVETMVCTGGDTSGRYVSFTRTGGTDPHDAAICEFIVFGYKVNECDSAFCKENCDPLIGCDECVSGKMLPDCQQDCPDGYWGVNCADLCGMCKDDIVCDKVTGMCGPSCKGWYIPERCTVQLGAPSTSQNDTVAQITSNTATVTWQRSAGFDLDVQQYFYYTVRYRKSSQIDWATTDKLPFTYALLFQYELSSLDFNTDYNIEIVPHRSINGNAEEGQIKVHNFKTLCREPETPPTPAISGTPESLTITWDSVTDLFSGCDSIEILRIRITCSNSTYTTVNTAYDVPTTNTSFTYKTVGAIFCEVFLILINNQYLFATSAMTSSKTTTATYSSTATEAITIHTQQITNDAGSGSGPNVSTIIVGSVCGMIIIILVAVIVVLVLRYIHLYRRHNGLKQRNLTTPDSNTPVDYGKANPVYENTKNDDNADMETNINHSTEYASVEYTTKVGNKATMKKTIDTVYENTEGPETQYESLDDPRRTTLKPPPVYQELK